ncbi:MAG TPA: Hsp70 family protein [Stellaceae bacterium]|nr:Hsp70 family protein [Stellaceae bacterium]
MKLFQIEEPDGSPIDGAEGPGAAVGIDIAPGGVGRVAIAVGGNGEILPDADGERTLQAPDIKALLLGLRSRAEKQLARPVTHVVIATDETTQRRVKAAAAESGLTVLRMIERGAAAALIKGAAAEEAAVLGAAVAAEDASPST